MADLIIGRSGYRAAKNSDTIHGCCKLPDGICGDVVKITAAINFCGSCSRKLKVNFSGSLAETGVIVSKSKKFKNKLDKFIYTFLYLSILHYYLNFLNQPYLSIVF